MRECRTLILSFFLSQERFEKSTREHEESPLSFENVFGDFVKERARETARAKEAGEEEEEESQKHSGEKKRKIKKNVLKKRKITTPK